MSQLVSICIPAYNQPSLTKRLLESVAAQSYASFEVVLSDDSTTAEVRDLVYSIIAEKNIKLVYHHNSTALGSPANWNKALDLASGDLIKIMHHDDWFSGPESLAKLVNELNSSSGCEFVFCASEILNLSDNTKSKNQPDESFLDSLKKDPKALFDNNKIGAPTATLFVNKKGLRFDERLKYLVDVDFYIRYLSENKRFAYVPEMLIVNTSGNTEQVTASSLNKQIQIGEYSYLYNKLYKGAFPDKKMRIFFKKLFAHYRPGSLREVESWGYGTPRPEWIFKWLLLKTKIPFL